MQALPAVVAARGERFRLPVGERRQRCKLCRRWWRPERLDTRWLAQAGFNIIDPEHLFGLCSVAEKHQAGYATQRRAVPVEHLTPLIDVPAVVQDSQARVRIELERPAVPAGRAAYAQVLHLPPGPLVLARVEFAGRVGAIAGQVRCIDWPDDEHPAALLHQAPQRAGTSLLRLCRCRAVVIDPQLDHSGPIPHRQRPSNPATRPDAQCAAGRPGPVLSWIEPDFTAEFEFRR